MLVLSRKCDESIVIGANITLRVLAIYGKNVRLGIDAPKETSVRRAELPQAGLTLERDTCSGDCIAGDGQETAS